MKKMGKKIEAMLPNGFGYALLVFPYYNIGTANYISSAKRADMIKAMRECADRLENREDFKTPGDNMYGT